MNVTTLRADLVTKDLGWSDAVPASWQVLPCRAIVEEQTEKNENAKNQNYLSLIANVGIIPYAEKGDVGNKKPEDLSKCKVVKKGDLVINSMNYGIGSYGLSGLDGVCSPVYIVLKPKSKLVHERYALRIFESKSFQKYAQSFGTGILEHRAAIGWDDLKNINIGIPTLEEQHALLSYLDVETNRIDALLNKKIRFIELLREKRQALITHAVSKGLNPQAKMKDSGVQWLGEVPDHWKVQRLRYAASINPAIRPSLEDAQVVTFLPMEAISEDGEIDTHRSRRVGDVKVGYSYFESGDVAFAKVTPCFENGKGAVMRGLIDDAGFGTTELTVLRPNRSVIPQYLDLIIRSQRFRAQGEGAMTGAGGLKRVPDDFTRNFFIALPSIAEQKEILTAINNELTHIDELVQKTKRSIDLLTERRSALITAAVTGQIELRQSHDA